MGKYRRRIDIIADILSSATNGATKKTWIMYAANLSHSLLEKYLAEMVNLELLRLNNNNRYEITEKGLIFLKKYRCFINKYAEIQRELQASLSEMRDLEKMCNLLNNTKQSLKRNK